MPGETFTLEELASLNDLRRRIANGHEYNEEEVSKAINLFQAKRAEALRAVEKPAKAAKTSKSSKTIDLEDLDSL